MLLSYGYSLVEIEVRPYKNNKGQNNRKENQMNHKRAKIGGGIFLTAAISAMLPAVLASAHDGTANGTCQGGVVWEYHDYNKDVTNTIVVKVDGVVVYQDLDFKASDSGSYATDKTVGHTWSVDVNAPGTQYDRHKDGSYEACETAPTTTTVPEEPTTTTTVVTDTTTVDTVAVTPDCRDTGTCELPQTPTTLAATAEEPQLPATGADWTAVGIVAAVLVMSGLALHFKSKPSSERR